MSSEPISKCTSTEPGATTGPTSEQLKANIRKMLTMHCGQPVQCKCGKDQWFIRMAKSGKLNPMTDEAISHYVDCPFAKDFRKDKS